jgi:hypothetical protein
MVTDCRRKRGHTRAAEVGIILRTTASHAGIADTGTTTLAVVRVIQQRANVVDE